MQKQISMIYQIFTDRFAIGNNETIHSKIDKGLYDASIQPKEWIDLPSKESGRAVEHFGGDLDGIVEHLDYIADLGADAIYITPIHNASTYHRYDATDYRSVAPELGGMDGFDRLITALHKRNMKLVMDLVLNHLSSNHPFFTKAQNADSSWRDFFTFNDDGSYKCWWGNDWLPELNLENERVYEEFITGRDSVLNFWISRGVDAFRLDCANDLGLTLSSKVASDAKKIKSDILIFGEVFHYPAEWMAVLDGVQSYYVTNAIYSLLLKEIDPLSFSRNLNDIYSVFPESPRINSSWSMLSSHDYPRPMSLLSENKKQLKLALVLQFFLPGIPMIYYGDENGMTGGDDPFNRAPMIWDNTLWNNEIRTFYYEIIKIRKSAPEFSHGRFIDLTDRLKNTVIGFIRIDPDEPRNYSIVLVNPTCTDEKITLFIPLSYLFTDMDLVDRLSGRRVKTMGGTISVGIEEQSAMILSPDYFCKKNFQYCSRR